MIIFHNVSKIYKIKKKDNIVALNNLSFQVKKGEIKFLLGPNGAGKTTTVKCLLGILKPDSGQIELNNYLIYSNQNKYFSSNNINNNQDLLNSTNNFYNHNKQKKNLSFNKHRNKILKKIGVIFGNKSHLIWDLPVIDSYKLIGKLYDIKKNLLMDRINKFSKLLEVDKLITRAPKTLSLGQKVKCNIIAAFLPMPELIIMDEPTIGVDIVSKMKIYEFIKFNNKKYNITFLITTHDISWLQKFNTNILVIDNGKKVFDGNLQYLKEKFIKNHRFIIKFNHNINNYISDNTNIKNDNNVNKKIINNFDKNIKEQVKTDISNIIKKYKIKARFSVKNNVIIIDTDNKREYINFLKDFMNIYEVIDIEEKQIDYLDDILISLLNKKQLYF